MMLFLCIALSSLALWLQISAASSSSHSILCLLNLVICWVLLGFLIPILWSRKCPQKTKVTVGLTSLFFLSSKDSESYSVCWSMSARNLLIHLLFFSFTIMGHQDWLQLLHHSWKCHSLFALGWWHNSLILILFTDKYESDRWLSCVHQKIFHFSPPIHAVRSGHVTIFCPIDYEWKWW